MNFQTLSTARRSTLAIAALIGTTVALAGTPANAQLTELDVLRQQILELQNKLTALEEAQKKVAAPAAPTVASSSKLPVTVSGLLQMHALGRLDDDRGGSSLKDTLRIRRGEIRITAPNITSNISGTVMFDLGKTSANGTNSSGTTVGTERNAILQELVLTWQAQKNANYNTFVDIGQYKVPFGYEGDLVSSGALQAVERALYYRSSVVNSSIRLAGDQRERGILVRGNVGEFDYNLGIFDGLGERQNTTDFDSNKALAARLIYKPKSLAGLQIGASYATGKVGNLNFLGATQRFERDLANAFVVYKKDKLTAQAEYFDVSVKGETTGTEVDGRSYYGSLGYLFTPQLEGVLRYDEFDANRDSDNAKTKESTLGLNYYIKGNNAKVQANLVKTDRPTSEGESQDNTELRVNFQVAF